jgi:hypothetical protein
MQDSYENVREYIEAVPSPLDNAWRPDLPAWRELPSLGLGVRVADRPVRIDLQ